MSSDKVGCIICSRIISWPAFYKHIFSCAHKNDIKNALFRSKTTIMRDIDKDKPVSLYFKNASKRYNICFPCRTMKKTLYNDTPKAHICDKGAENRKIIKELLTSMTEPVREEVVEEVSSEEVILLRETVKKLEGDAKKAKKLDHRALDMKDALSSVMSDLREKDFELFKDKMVEMKREYSLAFEVIYKELGGVEGHESEFNEED